ncbi:MAG: hypothetical protein OXP69_08835 [Spirochaetaceae bacterium]|nr:hypothetical protein [Spirochaetaceae bacterium]
MRYLVDANVFISAKNLHYGFDFLSGILGLAHPREFARTRVQH